MSSRLAAKDKELTDSHSLGAWRSGTRLRCHDGLQDGLIFSTDSLARRGGRAKC